MLKVDPTANYPIRSYIPKMHQKISTISKHLKFKPGFLSQYLEIKKLLSNKLNYNSNLCNLDQGIKVLSLIETIIAKSKK